MSIYRHVTEELGGAPPVYYRQPEWFTRSRNGGRRNKDAFFPVEIIPGGFPDRNGRYLHNVNYAPVTQIGADWQCLLRRTKAV
jgi:hypothetical protein